MLNLCDKPLQPLIAPSILSADFGHMIRDCTQMFDLDADLLHLDVMDGHFVPNITFGADMIRALRTHLPNAFLDAHLMVARPSDYVESFATAGANSFVFHIETTNICRGASGIQGEELITRIRNNGMAPGIAINPDTPVESLESLLPLVDMALVMSVRPGFSGQSFIPQVLDKVRWLAQRCKPTQRIQMDGGINPETIDGCLDAGADVIVAASAIFGHADSASRQQVIHRLRGVK